MTSVVQATRLQLLSPASVSQKRTSAQAGKRAGKKVVIKNEAREGRMFGIFKLDHADSVSDLKSSGQVCPSKSATCELRPQ